MKYFLFFFLFLFLLFLNLNKLSYAEFTNFDFSLNSYFIKQGNSIDIDFKYLLSGYKESDFLVRPVIENGFVEILDVDKGKWISSLDLLNNLPNLGKSMKIKISRFEIEKTSLNFEIYNIITGEIYKTPKKDIWSEEIYSDYVSKVNSNLDRLKFNKFNESEMNESVESSNTVDVAVINDSGRNKLIDSINSVPKIYFFLFSLGVFLLSIAFGIRSVIKKKDVARW